MKISAVNGAHQGGRGIGATELSVVGIPGIAVDRAGVLVDRTCAKIDQRVVGQVERKRRRGGGKQSDNRLIEETDKKSNGKVPLLLPSYRLPNLHDL